MLSCRVQLIERPQVSVQPLAKTDGGEALSDNQLVAAIAAGDHGAFKALLGRHLSGMVALAYRVVFDVDQASEIAQEAFLRVWKHAAGWDPDGSASFSTWLSRVVINLSISHRRRRREQVDIDTIEDLPSNFIDGFHAVAESDRKRVVRAALGKLPERQRAAIALYYFEELPQIKAAEIMQMTPRAFDSLIVRARVNLKKHLAGLGLSPAEIVP